jgi:hypothetical protein
MLGRNVPEFFKDIKLNANDQENQVSLQKSTKVLDVDSYDYVEGLFDQYGDNFDELYENAKNKKKVIQEYIILAFYGLLPPFRSNDLIDLAIVEVDPKDNKINYLNLNTGKLFYTKYKTSNTYGDIVLDTPAELTDILKRFYQTFNTIDGYKYIFTTENNKLMSSQNFSKLVKSIRDLNLSPNDLRNLYVSSLKDVPIEERAKIAKYMKHALSSQLLIYNKYNKENF